MYYTLKKITLYLLLLSPLYSQVSNGGNPKSIQAGLIDDMPEVIMSRVDRNTLLREDEIEMAKDVPYRFGTPFEVQYNLDNSGVWEEVSEGRIWRLSIHSRDAYSINLL